MANTIASAVRYINNDAELDKIFKAKSFAADFLKENVAVGARTVKYRKTTLGTGELGDFDREEGYDPMDVNVAWEEKTLTQDKGNSLHLDKMDGEEAQSLEIVRVHKTWSEKKMIPYVDKYVFTAIATNTGIHKTSAETLSKTNIEASIDAGLDYLFGKGVMDDVVLIIKTSAARALKNAAKDKGTLTLGTFGGNLESNVLVYGDTVKAKVVQVPDAYLPAKTNYVLCPEAAIAFMVKYQEQVYFDKIPGFGGRKQQVDAGIYFDAWVEPGAEEAVFVSINAA